MATPAFLDSISPWNSRSTTPKPGQPRTDGKTTGAGLEKQRQGGDHSISHRNHLSLRDYPEDCPPLNIRWFYAVDVRDPEAIAHSLLGVCSIDNLQRYRRENRYPSRPIRQIPRLSWHPKNSALSQAEIRVLSRPPSKSSQMKRRKHGGRDISVQRLQELKLILPMQYLILVRTKIQASMIRQERSKVALSKYP